MENHWEDCLEGGTLGEKGVLMSSESHTYTHRDKVLDGDTASFLSHQTDTRGSDWGLAGLNTLTGSALSLTCWDCCRSSMRSCKIWLSYCRLCRRIWRRSLSTASLSSSLWLSVSDSATARHAGCSCCRALYSVASSSSILCTASHVYTHTNTQPCTCTCRNTHRQEQGAHTDTHKYAQRHTSLWPWQLCQTLFHLILATFWVKALAANHFLIRNTQAPPRKYSIWHLKSKLFGRHANNKTEQMKWLEFQKKWPVYSSLNTLYSKTIILKTANK